MENEKKPIRRVNMSKFKEELDKLPKEERMKIIESLVSKIDDRIAYLEGEQNNVNTSYKDEDGEIFIKSLIDKIDNKISEFENKEEK